MAGGRADGNPSRSSFKRALRKGISAPTRTNDDSLALRFPTSFVRSFVRSFGSSSTLVRVNEVGRNADKFSLFRPLCRLFADQQTVREEDHRSWSERAGSGLTWFHGKSGGVLRFLSLSPEFRYLAHFMPPSTVATDLRVEREQKEARSTAVKWRPGDRQPREREREKGGGTLELVGFGQRKDSVPLAAFICHTSQSPQNVGSAGRAAAVGAPCKKTRT